MPVYEFNCRSCGNFPHMASIAERDQPVRCPDCGVLARRMVSAPNLAVMTPQRRDAHARNEKSRHEPAMTSRHRCGSSCGCSSAKTKAKREVTVPKLGSFQTTRKRNRPWMLGH